MEVKLGGSSGGNVSTLDLSKITSVANERIREAFSVRRKILLVCGSDDEEYLLETIRRSRDFENLDYEVASSQSDLSSERVAGFSLVVTFVHQSGKHDAINLAVQLGTAQRKTVLFVRVSDNSQIPQYVLQYRIRAVTWNELMDLLRQ